jgi:Outer membrane protein beta-barrel domain
MKYIFVFIFAMSIATSMRAQVQFGVKAGYNHANLIYSGSSINDLGVRSDFNAGVFASIPLFSHFYLQPELMYSGQGSRSTDSIPKNAIYNYLNLPILFKYQHNSGLFVETGPQVGFLLNAQLSISDQSIDTRNYTQSADFSWVFGLGYKIPVINLGIDMRYNLGLTNTNKMDNAGTAKNSVFQIGLFYQFKMSSS